MMEIADAQNQLSAIVKFALRLSVCGSGLLRRRHEDKKMEINKVKCFLLPWTGRGIFTIPPAPLTKENQWPTKTMRVSS